MVVPSKIEVNDNLLEGFSVPFFREFTSSPPHLLNDLYQSKDEKKLICLIAKDKVEKAPEPSYGTPVQVRSKKSRQAKQSGSSDLDLTGSPLKCSFTLDPDDDTLDDSNVETFISRKLDKGPSYVPVSLIEARKCIRLYNLATEGCDDESCPPCWVVCDAEDGTLFVGAKRLPKALTLNKVTWSGPHERKEDALKLDNFLKKYHTCVAPVGSQVKTETVAKAIYNLSEQLGGIADDVQQGVGSDVNSLKVLMSWISPRSFLERPPLQSAAEIHMEIYPGEEKMATYKLFSGLELLKGFASGLFNQSIIWRKSEANERTLQEEIENLFDIMKQYGPRSAGSSGPKKSETEDSLSEELEDLISIDERTDMDFSDLLWNCLIKVESYAQLSNAITYIIKTIQAAELRPFIYPKNRTRVVQIVQEMIRGSDEIPEMSGKLPLEILVEIGIEKLQRDYVHSLLSNYLASREDLAPFLTLDHLSNVELSISNLSKLHTVHELVCLNQMYLSSKQDCLRSIVQQSLKQLKIRDISTQANPLKFVFPISSAHVKEQLTKSNPSVWQCHVATKSSSLDVSTSAHLTLESPSEFIPVKIESCDVSTDKLDVTYYCTVASSITRRGV